MDGFEATNLIRLEYMKCLKKQPIIIGLSSEDYEIMQKKSNEAGMNNFVQKPASIENLRQYIAKV